MKILCNICRKKRDEKFIKYLEDGSVSCEKCLRTPVFLPKSNRPKRNKPCICGSEKKYKDCCHQKMLEEFRAR